MLHYFVLDMATSTAAQGKVYCIHSNVYAYLPDVSCSWPMLLGGDEEEEREHHPTRMRSGPLWKGGSMCIFMCAMSLCCQGVDCLSTVVMV